MIVDQSAFVLKKCRKEDEAKGQAGCLSYIKEKVIQRKQTRYTVPTVGTKLHTLYLKAAGGIDASMTVEQSVLVLKKYRKEEEAKVQDALYL